MRQSRGLCAGLVGSVLGLAAPAQATTELPPVSDARSAALGGTGVAYVQNGAAPFHNPAGLHGMEQGALTLSISPLMTKLYAPLNGPGTSVGSSRSPFPMFLAGGGYRVHDRVVLGMAVFPTVGFGGKYSNVASLGGEEISAMAAAFEAAPSAAFAITDDIAVGLAYRVTYMLQRMRTLQPPAPVAEMDLDGFSFLGAHLGVAARVAENTQLGLSYRTKATVSLAGTTETAGQSMDTESEFSAPHSFKLGVAQELLEDRLLLALDLKYSLFADSNQSQVFTTAMPDGTQLEQENTMDWKNAVAVYLGGEYRLEPAGPDLRLGYSLSQSATPEKYANPFFAPPGIIHGVHAGAGMTFSQLDLDLGGYYAWGSSDVSPEAGIPGEYAVNTILLAASATYRL